MPAEELVKQAGRQATSVDTKVQACVQNCCMLHHRLAAQVHKTSIQACLSACLPALTASILLPAQACPACLPPAPTPQSLLQTNLPTNSLILLPGSLHKPT